ncbi:nicotinate phosphoribosyltransferase [Aureibacillus halotolerans]|uniref:Nicotinate phosphoribosyltransferase n=1 Tax=Aureibacillus halotolerans TaxID=1508390 RepID=A0A4R6U6U6_9BACI|nr:nicotinate phosphoribosyltransferase [Aureibacillus halotolerans]TDQ41486.1 nicotinate phosphoribosyltransferase [Aureibacillus halotolerans]
MNYGNLTLHTDKYQINQMYAHWKNGTHNRKRVFNAFFRKNPFHNGYAVFAGLERIIEYIEQLRFEEEDIAYLQQQPESYDAAFLDALRSFRFTGTIYSVEEGQIVFPNEPIIRVECRVFEGHMIETALLNFMNYQTLIATKASRIRQIVGENDILLEFGTRRAQEADAAIWGARAAYIAGFHATSNMRAGKLFSIPTAGTHAHAWVQDHESEIEAFKSYMNVFPDNATLLVDTYNTLKSGVPNAIKVAKIMAEKGHRLKAIRLDSGDLATLSKEARRMLDEAGFEDVQISASNDLDEEVILHLKLQDAKITMWGIGTKLITAAESPALGGVYKMVAKETETGYEPVIKISENPEKIPTPGFTTLYRIINNRTGKTEGDYVAMVDENVQQEKLKMFDPSNPYKFKIVKDYTAKELLKPVFIDGSLVYKKKTVEEIRQFHFEQLQSIWEPTLRLLNPQTYFVDLSQKVYDTKMALIDQHAREAEEDN